MTDFVSITQSGTRQVTPEDLNTAFADANTITSAKMLLWWNSLPRSLPNQSNQFWVNGRTLALS